MNAHQPELGAAYRLSFALIPLLCVAALAGLLVPGLYSHDAPVWAAQARGTDFITLVVAVPMLWASMVLARRGSLSARIVWLGVLSYVSYSYVMYAFDLAFNPLFLVYVGVLSLSVWSLIVLLTHTDALAISLRCSQSIPRRAVAMYLLAVAVLFSLTWLKDIVPAIITSTTPADVLEAGLPTNPVHVLDLSFLLPLCVIAGLWLFRRRPWGYPIAGLLLVKTSLLGASIVSDTVFGSLDGQSVSLSAIPMFGVLTLGSAFLAVRFLQHLH